MTVGKDVSALFPDVANCMQVNQIQNDEIWLPAIAITENAGQK